MQNLPKNLEFLRLQWSSLTQDVYGLEKIFEIIGGIFSLETLSLTITGTHNDNRVV